jgi:hypothetical protein
MASVSFYNDFLQGTASRSASTASRIDDDDDDGDDGERPLYGTDDDAAAADGIVAPPMPIRQQKTSVSAVFSRGDETRHGYATSSSSSPAVTPHRSQSLLFGDDSDDGGDGDGGDTAASVSVPLGAKKTAPPAKKRAAAAAPAAATKRKKPTKVAVASESESERDEDAEPEPAVKPAKKRSKMAPAHKEAVTRNLIKGGRAKGSRNLPPAIREYALKKLADAVDTMKKVAGAESAPNVATITAQIVERLPSLYPSTPLPKYKTLYALLLRHLRKKKKPSAKDAAAAEADLATSLPPPLLAPLDARSLDGVTAELRVVGTRVADLQDSVKALLQQSQELHAMLQMQSKQYNI